VRQDSVERGVAVGKELQFARVRVEQAHLGYALRRMSVAWKLSMTLCVGIERVLTRRWRRGSEGALPRMDFSAALVETLVGLIHPRPISGRAIISLETVVWTPRNSVQVLGCTSIVL